ncbi:isoprenoid synthase domain-containing protein [Fimicolochytrium jonesii]|uniref:isoprenoid synthase domain-containing protein n=1 Tax=Fimicolochytrium jonesii TaxID=1396493 RepID=UPI0022FDE326|nr:isoprenoid synthase domain-containing protein [Fimicolochytrium jonesii]KAI8817577.1 isoprenoid synthase domain-containing protein [Fimicolochytrium jonesii]
MSFPAKSVPRVGVFSSKLHQAHKPRRRHFAAPTSRPATTPAPLQNAQNYVTTLLQKHDYDNYLASLFVPARSRDAVWAVRAFNVETALIRESVKDSLLGKARIQWWRDAVDDVFAGRPPNHPVTLMLAQALETAPLSKSWFKRMLTERESNLQDPQYAKIADLEKYAENTASSLLYLQLEALGIRNHDAEHAAGHVGKAIGIATLLRATPFHVEERRFYLPSEIMAKHGLSTETVFRTGPSQALEEVVFEVATAANDQLITARSFMTDMPPAAIPALLPAVPVDLFLQALEKNNFNLFDAKLGKKSWKLHYRLWKAARSLTI